LELDVWLFGVLIYLGEILNSLPYALKMNILITGVAGFFGVNLASKFLTDKSNFVIGVDNFASGTQEHVNYLQKHENFSFLRADCRDLTELTSIFPKNIDLIVHLAANSDIAAAISNPLIDFDLGINTTQNMLELARQFGVPRFVFSSGSGVYGEAPEEIFSEISFTGRPISTYGASKLSSEALISAYSFMFGIKASIFRFCNLIGTAQTHGVIFDFIRKLHADPKTLQVLGDGTQLKPYIHIADAVAAIEKVMDEQSSEFEVFNVSNDDAISVREIVGEVLSEMDLLDCNVIYEISDRGWKADIPKYSMSSSKLENLGWHSSGDSLTAVRRAIIENLTGALPA
jgi:UDP-glucose 4-epimerase